MLTTLRSKILNPEKLQVLSRLASTPEFMDRHFSKLVANANFSVDESDAATEALLKKFGSV